MVGVMDGIEYATWALVVVTAVTVLINVLLVWDNHWHLRRQANPVVVGSVIHASLSKLGNDQILKVKVALQVAGSEPAFNVEVSADWRNVHRTVEIGKSEQYDLRTYPYLAVGDRSEWEGSNRIPRWTELNDGFPTLVEFGLKVRYQNATRDHYISRVAFAPIVTRVPSGEGTSSYNFESGHFKSKRDHFLPGGRLDRFLRWTRVAYHMPRGFYPWQ
jgi:hypothetical protein